MNYDGLITNRTAKLPSVLRGVPQTPGSLTIVLPLPPKELSPNARVCWQAKARAVKQYREAAKNACESTARWKTATVQARFYFTSNRRRDKDNLLASLKSAFDGLVDGGLLVDDAGLTHLPVEVVVDKERPRVEIVVSKG